MSGSFRKIIAPSAEILAAIDAMTPEQSFRAKNEGRRILPLRAKPCKGCAVVWNFYREFSDALKQCPLPLQIETAERWFCHETPGYACRGNAANLGCEVISAIKSREVQHRSRAASVETVADCCAPMACSNASPAVEGRIDSGSNSPSYSDVPPPNTEPVTISSQPKTPDAMARRVVTGALSHPAAHPPATANWRAASDRAAPFIQDRT